jgi:hypothetical protein
MIPITTNNWLVIFRTFHSESVEKSKIVQDPPRSQKRPMKLWLYQSIPFYLGCLSWTALIIVQSMASQGLASVVGSTTLPLMMLIYEYGDQSFYEGEGEDHADPLHIGSHSPSRLVMATRDGSNCYSPWCTCIILKTKIEHLRTPPCKWKTSWSMLVW